MSNHAYVMRDQCHLYAGPCGSHRARWNRLRKLFRSVVEIAVFLLAAGSCVAALLLVA